MVQSSLDSVTYREQYTPSNESLAFIAFIRAASVEDNSNAEIHYRLADKFFSKDKQILVEAFRGSAKSTITEWLVLYVAVLGYWPGFGKCPFIAFIGDSAENGVKNFFRNLEAKLDQSEFLRSLIRMDKDNYRKTDTEMELTNINGDTLYIKGYGAGTNIRGVRYRNHRPSAILLDDITTNEAATSETIQNTINNNFYKSIIPAMHPTKYKIVFIGTPISERDLIHQLSRNPEWVVHKFPICEKFPCTKEEFVGAWPDRFPYEAVKSRYDMYKESGQLQSFYQEYMLQVTDLSTLLVEEDDIRWFDYTTFLSNKGRYNYYIVTDFATSTKKSADYSTIGVIALSSNGDWLLVDGQCKRQTMQENIDDLFRFVYRWKPLAVGIESSGQQGGFISILQDLMIQRNIWFQLGRREGSKEPGIRPIKDKVHRFVTGVQPLFKQGKVWLPRPQTTPVGIALGLIPLIDELVDELSKLTMAGGVKALKHDDAIDLLNQMSEMETYRPSEDISGDTYEERRTNTGEYWAEWEEEEESWGSTIF